MSFKPTDKPDLPHINPDTLKTPPLVGQTPPFISSTKASIPLEQVTGGLGTPPFVNNPSLPSVSENTLPDASSLMKAAASIALQSALGKASPAMTGALAAGSAIAGMLNHIPEMPASAQDILDVAGNLSRASRTVTVSGAAIPPHILTFLSLSGQENLSELYNYTVQLKAADQLNIGYFSPSANLPLASMVGKDLSVSIEQEDGSKRHLSGLVTSAQVIGNQGREVVYELRLEPWLELATRTSDYKIFQNKSVVEIIDEVLSEYPFEVEKRLTECYPKRDFQVQYGESDYQFIQRLMEEFGIYYFFEHTENGHKLVLVDGIGTHQPCPGAENVSFHQQGLKLDKEYIHTIVAKESLRSGQWVMNDFDFTQPKASLTSTIAQPRTTGHPDYEHYEWPGDYLTKEEGDFLTRIRMEAQRSLGSRVTGSGNIRSLATGHTFTLENCPTVEANQEYLIINTAFSIQDIGEHSGQQQPFQYSTSFELQPTSELYRPQRTIRKPHTRGPQSAIVTGPKGEEIWTDNYGRVKVQFLWDRYGQWDENSSCWIRVSQPWAGKGFGGMQIPRIGQEVIVDFNNGDPDLPIITGRVYNADTMPPWSLPGNKTQSGMFSRSMKGGSSNGNALRFEDKEGGEQVWFHAERDLDTDVNNNETHLVKKDRTKTIIKNETVYVGLDRSSTIDQNETVYVGLDRNSTIDKNDTQTVKLMQTVTVGTDFVLDAGNSITLRCGESSLTMNKEGNIMLNGVTILQTASSGFTAIGEPIHLNPEGEPMEPFDPESVEEKGLFDVISDGLSDVADTVSQGLGTAAGTVAGLVAGDEAAAQVAEAVTGGLQDAKNTVAGAVSAAGDKVSQAKEAISNTASEIADNVSNTVSNVANTVAQSDLGQAVQGAVDSAASNIQHSASVANEAASNTYNNKKS